MEFYFNDPIQYLYANENMINEPTLKIKKMAIELIIELTRYSPDIT